MNQTVLPIRTTACFGRLRFFDTRRAADYLGLSHRTLDGYRVSGDGPAFHRFGNRVRYRRPDLDAWAARRRATTTAEADRLARGAKGGI